MGQRRHHSGSQRRAALMVSLADHQSSDFTKPKRIRGSLRERFNNYLSKPVPGTGCVIWLGGKNARGYGQIKDEDGPQLAHRVAWRLAGRRFTPGLELLHKCNNPACVNLDHLVEGTHKENMQDAVAAGVMGRPSSFGQATYNSVRAMKAAGRRQRDIALVIGCSEAMVSKILKGGVVHDKSS